MKLTHICASVSVCVSQVMRDTQGSDLPRFTAEESQLLRDTTIDFFSVNFYCGYYVWAPPADAPKNMVSWGTVAELYTLAYGACDLYGGLHGLVGS